MEEIVIVFKDKKSRTIETFVDMNGHGARVTVSEFMQMVSDKYGSPTTTLTQKSHEAKLQQAAELVIADMKASTSAIAAVQLEAPKPSNGL